MATKNIYHGWDKSCVVAECQSWYPLTELKSAINFIRATKWSDKEARAQALTKLNEIPRQAPFSQHKRFPKNGIFVCEGWGSWMQIFSQLRSILTDGNDHMAVFNLTSTMIEQIKRLEYVYTRATLESRLEIKWLD